MLKIYLPGVEVKSFTNARKALQQLDEVTATEQPMPDLIFCDREMPLMDGFEFIAQYEQKTAAWQERPSIILLTAGNTAKDQQTLAANPVVKMVLEKPLVADLIMQAIG